MERLFTPIMLGEAEIKNRVILPSMCVHFCEKDGHMNDCFREYVRRRAAGGAGLLIIPGSPHGKVGAGRPALSDDSYLPDWMELAELVHRCGAKLFCQLHPAKAQAGRGHSFEKPSDFTQEELEGLIESYARCALRCREAGVDGVDIHGAHAHEIALFLSGLYNDRTDKYGGSTEGRALFPARIIKAVKAACGPGFPVIFRISAAELVKGGRGIEETGETAGILEAAGADAIHVSIGMPESGGYISAAMDVEDCFNVEHAAVIKSYVNIPVIAVNRIVDIKDAVRVVEQGKADMVSMARAQLADPELVNKYLGLNQEPVYRCVGCNQGCKDKKARKKITCLQNPLLGREELVRFPPAGEEEKGKSILIAGAGPAGLELACNLARRGLKPEIYDKGPEPGGLVKLSALAPRKKNMLSLIDSRVAFLARHGIAVQCGVEVTEGLVRERNPHVLVVATGSRPAVPELPGIHGSGVMTGDEALTARGIRGKHVVVLGAGLVGCEAADYLAEAGNRVTIVDEAEEAASALNAFRRGFLLERMRGHSIRFMMETRITGISLPGVNVLQHGAAKTIGDVDLLVAAAGRKPVRELESATAPGRRILVLGDAGEPATALQAIWNSVEPALHIFD